MIDQLMAGNMAEQIDNIRAFQEINKQPEAPQATSEFQRVLGNLINDVDQAQRKADLSLQSLAKGENTSIQDVVMNMEEASLSFKLMSEIRGKLLDSYKEIMQMQA